MKRWTALMSRRVSRSAGDDESEAEGVKPEAVAAVLCMAVAAALVPEPVPEPELEPEQHHERVTDLELMFFAMCYQILPRTVIGDVIHLCRGETRKRQRTIYRSMNSCPTHGTVFPKP